MSGNLRNNVRGFGNIENKLDEGRYKLTRQREAIFEVFRENHSEHLSAEEVYSLVQYKHPSIGLATVYRTLDILTQLGILHKVNFGEGKSRYEIAGSEQHQHHHVICVSCGKLAEVKNDLLQQLEAIVENEYGFEIIDHRLQFYGYCPSCRETQA